MRHPIGQVLRELKHFSVLNLDRPNRHFGERRFQLATLTADHKQRTVAGAYCLSDDVEGEIGQDRFRLLTNVKSLESSAALVPTVIGYDSLIAD